MIYAMKKIFFCLLFSTAFLGGLAQSSDALNESQGELQDRLQVSLKAVFESYPDLDSVELQCEDSIPIFLQLFFRKDALEGSAKGKFEGYYLVFEGDRYVLRQKYDTLFTFVFDERSIDLISQITDTSTFRAVFNRESLSFRRVYGWAGSIPAIFPEAAREKLADMIRNAFNNGCWVSEDSVLTIQAIVERDGAFGDMGVIVGHDTPFSDFIKERLANEMRCVPFHDAGGSPRRGGD